MTTEITPDPVRAARYRALRALAALEDAARELYVRLEKDPGARVSEKSAKILREEAARVTASLAVMEALREAEIPAAQEGLAGTCTGKCDHDAGTRSPFTGVYSWPDEAGPGPGTYLCFRCGIAGTPAAPLREDTSHRWSCLSQRDCRARKAANGGRIVPQAVADARETKAWRDGYERAAGAYGSQEGE
jgi:hypothetical protein